MVSISISIPAYNDEETIGQVITGSIASVSSITDDYEILVINDGSTDSTGKIAGGLAAKDSSIRIVTHEKNMGFGPTLKEVFKLPSKDWILFLPGDGQIPPGVLDGLWEHTKDYDFILGIRENRSDTLGRRVNSAVYNAAISILGGRRVRDVNSTVLLRRSIVERIEFAGEGAFVHAELFLEAAAGGFRITGKTVEHRKRKHGMGGGGKPDVIFKTVSDMWKYFVKKKLKREKSHGL